MNDGKSLSISAIPNVEKSQGKYVGTFLDYAFEKEQVRRCASARATRQE
jgi:hypothetical protein